MDIRELDLTAYSEAKPASPVDLLFIHDSVGGELMASPGRTIGESDILRSHPNGGGLRTLLSQNNYVAHEAANSSKIATGTNVCQWNRRFRDQMKKILTTRHQDKLFSDETINRVIVFQPASSASWIEEEGAGPGNPDSWKKTIANYKAAYTALLDHFLKEPDTLFIAVTAPPLVRPDSPKGIIGRILGKPDQAATEEAGKRIRSFNNWLKHFHSGWLRGYPLMNVVVFDYYDILTADGVSNWLRYPSRVGRRDHPNAEGNAQAAQRFIPFLNRAMNRMAEQKSPFFAGRPYLSANKAAAR
ncbi:MAG: hypothetical protein WDA72_11140 [Desulfomonilia bacterium]|jgi:hypothetical protein|nr:SGNH/GDSL hydrolase family protein [Deltaproteobacteria bacterium]